MTVENKPDLFPRESLPAGEFPGWTLPTREEWIVLNPSKKISSLTVSKENQIPKKHLP